MAKGVVPSLVNVSSWAERRRQRTRVHTADVTAVLHYTFLPTGPFSHHPLELRNTIAFHQSSCVAVLDKNKYCNRAVIACIPEPPACGSLNVLPSTFLHSIYRKTSEHHAAFGRRDTRVSNTESP